MLSFNKEISILIFTSGYWRSHLFQKLFSKWAFIKRINPIEEVVPNIEAFDVVLWENDINQAPPANINENKFFIFDYKDEGSREDLVKTANRWGIKNPRFMLLLAENDKLDTGCLPLPYPKLIKRGRFPQHLKDRRHGVFFLCAPTFVYMSDIQDLPYCIRYQNKYCYNQRLEWVEKLANANLLDENQGLIHSDATYLKKENIRTLFNFDREVYTDPVPLKKYTERLTQSKIVLCPGGHSRWTYRHIEGMYNRSLVVSGNLWNWRTLPFLPRETMITVPDGDFNTKAIIEISKNIDIYQEKADLGFEFARATYSHESLISKAGYNTQKAREMFLTLLKWFDDNRHRQ